MNIPEGHQAVMPYLMLSDAEGFINFIEKVFDARLRVRQMRDDIIGHCEADIGGSTIMFSQARDRWKPAPANLFVYVEDADACYARAIEAGASEVTPLEDQDYGRSGGVEDANGNVWWITSVR
jgi:uncharacterized glyoxalase superfamily protein PhnB